MDAGWFYDRYDTMRLDEGAAVARGTSVRIFLAEGTADGPWIAEKSNWIGIALAIPRPAYRRMRERPELNAPGVYVLVGPPKSDVYEHSIYIGEAEILRSRLDQHAAQKEFWTRLIVFSSKDANLNKAHARFLESRLINLAQKAQTAELTNSTAPSVPALSDADQSDMETFLDNMLLIYRILGVRAFDSPSDGAKKSDEPVLRLQGPDSEATGSEVADGFIVFSGARARVATTPSFQFGRRRREELLEAAVLVRDGGSYVLTRDFEFRSPSEAAAVLLGRSANGRTEWRSESGQTLKEIQEA